MDLLLGAEPTGSEQKCCQFVSGSKTVAVLQPGYLPWLGFFDQMSRADVFVIYDDVQYDKNGWRNRNRIKSSSGPHWLTVPVHVKLGDRIDTVLVDNTKKWAKKHICSIQQFYKSAPYIEQYLPDLEELLLHDWDRLVDLDLALITRMSSWLGISTLLVRSSELGIEGSRNQRLVDLCLHFGADRYFSGNAAKSYLDLALFREKGIQVNFQEYVHPVYPQLHGDFVSNLSALDLLLNCGDASCDIFRWRQS